MRQEIGATLERLESPRALRQILSTLTGWSTAIVGENLVTLDNELAALGCMTLSQSQVQDQQTLRSIVERGRIGNRDEYRVASTFAGLEGPIGPSTTQRVRLLELLDAYSEDDRESADTAPLALAWRAAARDLNIQVISPYRLSVQDQPEIWCCGLLPDFGGTNGTAILGRFSSSGADVLAEQRAFYTSGLNPLYYELYERAQFETTLNDWGWFGHPLAPPPWFRGGLRRHGGPDAA
jgi:hypothetical protein